MAAIADHLTAVPVTASRGYWASVAARLSRDPVAMIALAVILLIVLAAIFAPLIAPADPIKGSMIRRLRPIGFPGYPLGSDELGRDMLARLIYGGRLSLFIGVTPVLCAFVIGSTIGIFAGYLGGWVNTLLMRIIDVFFAFPWCSAIALGALGAGILNSIVSYVVFVPQIARRRERHDANRARLCRSRARLRRRSAHHRPRSRTGKRASRSSPATSLISVSMISRRAIVPGREAGAGMGLMSPCARDLHAADGRRPPRRMIPTSISFNLFSDGLRSAMKSLNERDP